MEKLRVEISADSKDLSKDVKKAIKDLEKFEKAANEAAGSAGPKAFPKKGGSGFAGVGKASANATPALLEFNRTIQDAPFGIQGVANNIQQLTANFGYLKTQTGSTRNALKAMLAGLSGPQGILLVVSLVTALMVTFSNSMGKSATKAEKLTKATDKMAEALERFVKSQSAANRAIIEGTRNAQKEVVKLNQLRDAAEDTNKSTSERLKAIQELRRLFPDYFKDLSDEKILTGGLSGVYDQLTQSIIKRAKATAATNLLVKNAEKEVTISANLLKITNRLKEVDSERLAILDKVSQRNKQGAGGVKVLNFEEDDLLEEAADLRKQLEQILGDNIDLADLINENGGIDLSGVKLKGGDTLTLRPKVDIIAEEIGKFEIPNLVNRGSLGKDIEDALIGPLLELPNKIDIASLQAIIALNNFNDEANRIVQGSLADTFGQLGAVIGDALVNGGNVLEAVGTTLLQGIGNFLSRMGQLLIEYGTLAVIKGKLDLAILAGGPAAIGAGLVAIAVGTALTAAGSAFNGIASGNSGGGGVSGGGSSSSGSFSSSSGGGFGGGNVVFEISGRNLVGVLRRNTDSNLAING